MISSPGWLDSELFSMVLWTFGILVVGVVVQFVHFCVVLAWTDQQTAAGKYFELPADQRRSFKRRLHWHAVVLSPFLRLLAKISRFRFDNASLHHDGIAFPKGSCSESSLERAVRYRPRPEDVFVVTQMKCGTTWMQHLVLQVLTRGSADLPASGIALGALSPWLESNRTIDANAAPLVGSDRPSRILKTHLPATHLPASEHARYIYVARQPVSCFASCVDFLRSNLGPFAPSAEKCLEWFQSPASMWFGTWRDHVAGWCERAERSENVLLVRFEDMKADLPQVVEQIASFLDLDPLSPAELDQVVRKCGFEYMRDHADHFEMQPPHLFQHSGSYFLSGKADRYADVPEGLRSEIVEWCRQPHEASDSAWPELYDELQPRQQAAVSHS